MLCPKALPLLLALHMQLAMALPVPSELSEEKAAKIVKVN
jgi:hypothetical protein